MEESPLNFLSLICGLKKTPRTGWRRFIDRPESVADHSFGVATLGFFAPEHLDWNQCVLIGLCHDLAESVIGDIPTYAGVSKENKQKYETLAFEYLGTLLPPKVAERIKDLWLDYEYGRTKEGAFMKEMDKLECLHQASEYELETFGKKPGLGEFQGLHSKMKSEEGLAWSRELAKDRERHLASPRQRCNVVFVIGRWPHVPGANPMFFDEGIGHRVLLFGDFVKCKARDSSYELSSLLAQFVEARLRIPSIWAVSLLGSAISSVEGDEWILVCDFPETVEQLHEFERKVQYPNYSINLSDAEVTEEPDDWHQSVIPRLKLCPEYYAEVHETSVRAVRSAVQNFQHHAQELGQC